MTRRCSPWSREGFGRLVQEIVRHTQADAAELAAYLGRGMLLNVAGAMDLLGAETGLGGHGARGLLRGARGSAGLTGRRDPFSFGR